MTNANPAKSLTAPVGMKAPVPGDSAKLKFIDKPVPHSGAVEVRVKVRQ